MSKPVSIAEEEISEALHQQLITLLSSCFQGPHDDSFKIQSYWREPPTHRWIIFDADQSPAAQVTVHRCIIGSTAGDLVVGDIADVCVREDHRGQGLVRQMLAAAHTWMADQGYAFSFLSGNPKVYSSSGYKLASNIIRCYNPDSETWEEKPQDSSMVKPLTAQPWPAGKIDWRGPMY